MLCSETTLTEIFSLIQISKKLNIWWNTTDYLQRTQEIGFCHPANKLLVQSAEFALSGEAQKV
jgi:hypothetical protein